MPSSPKKSSTTKKSPLSAEEQTLLLKQRRDAIEKRIVRLEAKIAKDKALLQKYTPVMECEITA
jgi:hypothetical protein